MIAIGCCYISDPEGIKRLLDSCYKEVDLCFMIDGPFANYTGDYDLQTDLIVDEYPNVVYRDSNHLLEHQKRQIYLDLCGEYGIEFLVIVDSDEYFYDCKWGELQEELEQVCKDDYVYNIKSYTEIPGMGLVPIDQPRIIKNPGMLQYLGGHHYQLALKGTDEAITAKNTIYSIKLCHDAHLRSPERKEEHDKYIRWLKRYEAEKMLYETPKEKENRLASVWAGA